MAVLLFLAVLFVLILVHEWGHFIVAKKTGMRVDEFGIGFPPKLFGWKKGETEYTLNAFPIGGFVKILGEDGASAPSAPVSPRGEKLDVKLDAEPGLGGTQVVNLDQGRTFGSKPKWAQAAVLIAGVTMNVLFAWLLYVVIFMIGVPTQVDESVATNDVVLRIAAVVEESPAAAAGIPVGAEIVSVASAEETITELYPSNFKDFAQQNETFTLVYLSGGEEVAVKLSPEAGVVAESDDRAIGVALALVETVRQPIHTAIYNAGATTIETLGAITVGLSSLIVDSVRGQADFSQVAGPVGIVGLVGDAAQFGFTSLLLFTAVISLNLAVINLLPFPALDGGRLVFVAIEAITRRPINPVWVMRLNALGFFLLISLMLVVTYNDVLRLL